MALYFLNVPFQLHLVCVLVYYSIHAHCTSMYYVLSWQIEISRESNEISFGLTLSKEISEDDLGKAIIINTIVVGSPAYSAGVIAKDILIAIDGHKIESLKQAAKMIKNKSR